VSRLFILLFAVIIAAKPAIADDWPAAARIQMEAAGARLSAATTTGERVAALREIEAIAAAHPDAPDARITAALIGQKVSMEAGPEAMLDALGELAASGQITDTETLAGIAGPLLETVAQMQDDGTLLPSAAIGLDDAISKLNAATARAGLPSVADAISQVSGDPALGAALTGSLGRLANLAKVARDAPNLAELDEQATKDFIDNIVSIAPPIPAFGVNKVGYTMLRDQLAWNSQMFGESTKALNLVSDAIETGEFDHRAYNKIRDRLNELSKGPWNSDTAKDVLKSLCEAIPIAGAWCDDAFKLAEELVALVDCSAITCDCANVGGGLMRGPLTVTCKLQEQDLILQCEAAGKVTGSCDADAKGPGANY
jgi:hypothetical protein